jgi:hypothetical protein
MRVRADLGGDIALERAYAVTNHRARITRMHCLNP